MKTINCVRPPIEEGYIFPLPLEYLTSIKCSKPKKYFKRDNIISLRLLNLKNSLKKGII